MRERKKERGRDGEREERGHKMKRKGEGADDREEERAQ